MNADKHRAYARVMSDLKVAFLDAVSAADRAIFIDGGAMAEEAPPEEFFGNPKNQHLKDFLSKML